MITAAALTISGCGVAVLTAEEQAEIEKTVQQKIAAKDYTVDVNMMIPTVGRSRSVNRYSVRVSADTLESYLPYFGRVYSGVPYGNQKGLNFTALISEYNDVEAADGGHDISIHVSNEEDSYTYSIFISATGNASISVSSANKSRISFTGELNLE